MTKFILHRIAFIVLIILTLANTVSGQKFEYDKCGTNLKTESNLLELLGDHWGYSYDSLLNDIDKWEANEFVIINSIGQSILGREQYELTVTNSTIPEDQKHRIYIHARTHPGEIQAFWVTDEMINYLMDDTELGEFLRNTCIFHIIPMYNPDGVELEYPRENSNGVDIESNWNKTPGETEVINLRNRFLDLMGEVNPIEVALNMHSAYACKRYFVYHHSNGTSDLYEDLEKDFIGSVKDYFVEGIEPYFYYVSWTGGTPTQYPESWWWINYSENVMALTYEDMNCASAGFYDKTAFAILNGISDYLDLGVNIAYEDFNKNVLETLAYPNPFYDQITVEWNSFEKPGSAYISDISGRQVYVFSESEISNGSLLWEGNDQNNRSVSGGVYILNIVFENQAESVILIKQ